MNCESCPCTYNENVMITGWSNNILGEIVSITVFQHGIPTRFVLDTNNIDLQKRRDKVEKEIDKAFDEMEEILK